MNSLRVFPSFSGILCEIKDNKVSIDSLNDKDTIFCFGCSREGIKHTVDLYNDFYKNLHDLAKQLMPVLDNAETEGRFAWGFGANNSLDQISWKNARREWIKSQVISRGGIVGSSDMCNVVEFGRNCTCEYDMSWNLPALNRWFQHFVSGLDVSMSMR